MLAQISICSPFFHIQSVKQSCDKDTDDFESDNICATFAIPQDAVKVMAKDLVRTRRYTKKFIMMRAQIQAVSLKITTLKSQNAMAQAMKGVTRAMMNMNKWVVAEFVLPFCQWGNAESQNVYTFTCLVLYSGIKSVICFLSSPQAVEASSDSTDHARIWEAVRNYGHEGRDDEWRDRWCHGWWGRWGGKVSFVHCILKGLQEARKEG